MMQLPTGLFHRQGDLGQRCAHMVPLPHFPVKCKEHMATRKCKPIIKQKIK